MYAWRRVQLAKFETNPRLLASAKAYYRNHPKDFINHWVDTYDPRNAGTKKPTRMPLIMFPRQDEMVDFVYGCLEDDSNGLEEKCRDMGATWLCSAISVHLWLFWDGAAVGWGSRKAELVDKRGDPKCIFEKIRDIIRSVPACFLPRGFDPRMHMVHMAVINPETNASIIGEVGDNIGRGGRTRIYFKDESAHYERPESIEAALSENTRVQIDISSVNGPNNVFHRKREAGEEWAPGKQMTRGITRVFILDVFDHPEKTKEWFDMREREMTNQGLGHLFAQEVKRDYLAAVSGVIIPADWVRSCVDAHIKLKLDIGDNWMAALDVADDSLTGDRNALTLRQGIVLRSADEWGGVDPGVSANRAKDICEVLSPIDVQYDCIGVGAGVKSETNRLIREKKMPRGVRFIQWNAGMKPLHPERRVIEHDTQSPKNEDYFANLKAQGWHELMMRAYRTHKAVTQGQKFDPDTLFSIDSKMRLFHTVVKELSQPIRDKNPAGKMLVDKTPEGTKSPNVGDSVMMNYFPMPGPIIITSGAMNASRQLGAMGRRR